MSATGPTTERSTSWAGDEFSATTSAPRSTYCQQLFGGIEKYGTMGLGAAQRGLHSLPGGQVAKETMDDWALERAKKFEVWVKADGLNRLISENCLMKGAISTVVGGGGGVMLGAFLAPFDTMGGLKVQYRPFCLSTGSHSNFDIVHVAMCVALSQTFIVR